MCYPLRGRGGQRDTTNAVTLSNHTCANSRAHLRSAVLRYLAPSHIPIAPYLSSSPLTSDPRNSVLLTIVAMENMSFHYESYYPPQSQHAYPSPSSATTDEESNVNGDPQVATPQLPLLWVEEYHMPPQNAPTGAGTAAQTNNLLYSTTPLDGQPTHCPHSASDSCSPVPSDSYSPFTNSSSLGPQTPPIPDTYFDNNQWNTLPGDLTSLPYTVFDGLENKQPEVEALPYEQPYHEQVVDTYPAVHGDAYLGEAGFQEQEVGHHHQAPTQPHMTPMQPNPPAAGYGHPPITSMQADHTFRPFLGSSAAEVLRYAGMYDTFRAQQGLAGTQMNSVGPQDGNAFPPAPAYKRHRADPQPSYAGSEDYASLMTAPPMGQVDASTFAMPTMQSQASVGEQFPAYYSLPTPLTTAPVAGQSSLKRTRAELEEQETFDFAEGDDKTGASASASDDYDDVPFIICRWKSCHARVRCIREALTTHFSCHPEYADAKAGDRIKCLWVGCCSPKPILKGQFTRHLVNKIGHAMSMNPADTTGRPIGFDCGIGECPVNATARTSIQRHRKKAHGWLPKIKSR